MEKKTKELALKLQKQWMEIHNDWRTPVWGYFRDRAERILQGCEPNPFTITNLS